MKNPRISLLLPLLSALLCAAPLPAQTADPALIKHVDDHYNHLRTLRAHYAERYAGMGMDRTETGTLLLKKPGLMRWSYDNPPGKVFVLDGKFGWFYTPGDAQVARTPAKQLDDLRSPLRFLLGHTQLAKELDNLTTAPDGANFRITGVPKGMAQRVHLLTLIVNPTGLIQGMKIEETDGAITDFTFTGMEENIPVTPTDFTFTPPANIPVVSSAPQSNGRPPQSIGCRSRGGNCFRCCHPPTVVNLSEVEGPAVSTAMSSRLEHPLAQPFSVFSLLLRALCDSFLQKWQQIPMSSPYPTYLPQNTTNRLVQRVTRQSVK